MSKVADKTYDILVRSFEEFIKQNKDEKDINY